MNMLILVSSPLLQIDMFGLQSIKIKGLNIKVIGSISISIKHNKNAIRIADLFIGR